MSLCLCVTFSFSNRFSSFFYAVLLILHWPNMYFPPNNILHQISSSFYFSVFPLLPEQMFPFSKCFHSSNAFLSFTSQFSLPSLTKYLTSPFFLFLCWPNIILLSIFLLKYCTWSSLSSPRIEKEKHEYAPWFYADDFPLLQNYFNLSRS